MRLSWSGDAKRDLRDIRDYFVDRWGEAVAQDYVGRIVACATDVARDPLRLRHYHGDYKYVRAGAHYLMVTIDGAQNRTVIVRILHQSMDIARHLPDPGEA